jgi:hypothetical protein
MFVSQAKIEIPDVCPPNCELKGIDANINGWCDYCPIFNCMSTPVPAEFGVGSTFKLIEPEDYREDWAEEWKKFFDTGETPVLRIC